MTAILKRLEIRHLRLVDALANSTGMSAAAKHLHLTQSALSHQLKVLEDTLGYELFLRHGKKLVITAAGRRVLQTAKDVLGGITELQNDLKVMAQGEKVALRIGTECITTFQWLPRVIPQFKKQYPDIQVELNSQAATHVMQLLEQGDVDIAIKMFPAKETFQNHKLFSDRLVVVMAKDHPLANNKKISVEELISENLLLCPNAKQKLFMGLAQHVDIHNIQTTEFPLTEAIVEWCHAGMGVSVLADWAAAAWQQDAICVKPLDVPWGKRHWTAVTLPQSQPAYMKDFMALLKAMAPV